MTQEVMLYVLMGLAGLIVTLQIVTLATGGRKKQGEEMDALNELIQHQATQSLERQNALAESMTARVNEMNSWVLKALAEVRESTRVAQDAATRDMTELRERTYEKLSNVASALEENRQGLQEKIHERLSHAAISSDERIKGLSDSLDQRMSRFTSLVDEKLAETTKQLRDGLIQQQEANLKQLELMLAQMNDHMLKAQAEFGVKLEGTSAVVGRVNTSLGTLAEQARAMQDLGKDIHALQDVLMAPKLRGGLGETLLEEMLSMQLPKEMYEIQHSLDEGTRVDAIVKLNNKKVVVDSKFPLEAFQRMRGLESDQERFIARKEFERSVRERCDEIARKYIRPDKGTFNFALMYVPSEAIFYEIVGNPEKGGADLSAYCLNKKVLPVSPNSFFAYLQCVVIGMKGFEIQKNAEVMLEKIQELQIHFSRFYKDFSVMGGHFRKLMSKYEDSQKRATTFGRKMSELTHKEFQPVDVELESPAGLLDQVTEGGDDGPDGGPISAD